VFKYPTRFPMSTGRLSLLSTALLYMYLSLTLIPSVSSAQWKGSSKGHMPNAQTRGSLNVENKTLTAREFANASV
ncbi:MAG: hypothetical protein ABJ059_06790, partial [Hyphomicrobiales bacterium]